MEVRLQRWTTSSSSSKCVSTFTRYSKNNNPRHGPQQIVVSNRRNSKKVSWESRRWRGSLFQIPGPATVKDLSTRLVRVLDIHKHSWTPYSNNITKMSTLCSLRIQWTFIEWQSPDHACDNIPSTSIGIQQNTVTYMHNELTRNIICTATNAVKLVHWQLISQLLNTSR